MIAMDRASLASAIFYRDPLAAFGWLEKAFGFEPAMMITDPDGGLAHAQMSFGNGYVMIGSEWADYTKSPASIGGKNSQAVHVNLDSDVDAHCARATAAGAEIVQAPTDQFYGDRTYRARDPEGHVWTFAENKRPFSAEESAAATGLKIELFS
jgi:uncharacterized glyoxalase superfamily protein PhnB